MRYRAATLVNSAIFPTAVKNIPNRHSGRWRDDGRRYEIFGMGEIICNDPVTFQEMRALSRRQDLIAANSPQVVGQRRQLETEHGFGLRGGSGVGVQIDEVRQRGIIH